MRFTDAQTLSFVQGQAYEVNRRVYETRYPDYDFSRFIFVDTSSPEWSPGLLTYMSDESGAAKFQSGYAKDVPLADVSQDMQMKSFHLAAIGYQWNIEEINATMGFPGASLQSRRANAARKAYMKFMWDTTFFGQKEKGLFGLANYQGVAVVNAPNDGNAGSTYWVDEDGIGQKTPDQILRDVNNMLNGLFLQTQGVELADTILLPPEAYNYIAQTRMTQDSERTILEFLRRNNIYTQVTGRDLTIRALFGLSTAAADGTGRAVVYKNDQETVKLHLPMPHRFLPVWQDGPMNFAVPGIFRTGGVEMLTTYGARYLDKICQPAKKV